MSSLESKRAAEQPLTAKGRATRARILEVAAEQMFARGASATSIDDVKRAAKVSASQVGHYFGDKNALISAVINFQTEALLASQQPLLDQMDSFTALQAWRDLMLAKQAARNFESGCTIGSLASEMAERDPQLREELAAGFARWREPLRAGLATMREQGKLVPEADPDVLSYALLAALEGGLLLGQTMRSPVPLVAALDTALAHIRSLASAGTSPSPDQ